MAAGLNKVMLIGNLGRDPEVRYTPDGLAIANFTIATSERRKNKSGEYADSVEWHRIVAFGKLAEVCGEYLSKGRQIYAVGRLQTRSWEKDGVTRYTTEVVAAEVQFLGRRDDGGYDRSQGGGGNAVKNGPQGGDRQAPQAIPEDDIPF